MMIWKIMGMKATLNMMTEVREIIKWGMDLKLMMKKISVSMMGRTMMMKVDHASNSDMKTTHN